MFLPCILKPFPLQGTDKSSPGDEWKNDPAAAGCVCVKRLYRRKTSMALLNLVFWFYFSLKQAGVSFKQAGGQ